MYDKERVCVCERERERERERVEGGGRGQVERRKKKILIKIDAKCNLFLHSHRFDCGLTNTILELLSSREINE
jgi:hypothetical protein